MVESMEIETTIIYRNREQDKFVDKVYLGNITGFDYDCQAKVNQRIAAANSSDVKGSNIRNAQNSSSISKNLRG
jgi:hypothetical protein